MGNRAGSERLKSSKGNLLAGPASPHPPTHRHKTYHKVCILLEILIKIEITGCNIFRLLKHTFYSLIIVS